MLSKMNKDSKLLLLILGCFIAFLASCSTDQECYEPVNVNARTGFTLISVDSVDSAVIGIDTTYIKKARTNYKDTFLPTATITVLGEDKNFLIGSTGTSIGPLLNPDKDSIRYSLRIDTITALYDTITFFYESSVHFISNNCGYTYYFNLQNVKSSYNSIDSIALLRKDVTNGSSDINVRLYFKK